MLYLTEVALINYSSREVTLKIVYYGAGGATGPFLIRGS